MKVTFSSDSIKELVIEKVAEASGPVDLKNVMKMKEELNVFLSALLTKEEEDDL